MKAGFFIFALLFWLVACRRPVAELPKNWTGITSEVYLAIRSDGRPGTGTIIDPFDASTQEKFDRLMGFFPPGALTIHLGAGTFYTRGISQVEGIAGKEAEHDTFWRVRDGWVIQGQPGYHTRIKLMDDAVPAGRKYGWQVIGGAYNLDVNSCELSDLVLDCNYQKQSLNPLRRICGALITVTNGVYRRIKVVNAVSKDGAECFYLCIRSQSVAARALIEDCEVYDSGDGYYTAVSLMAEGNPSYTFNHSIIRGCYVEGQGNKNTNSIAFGLAFKNCTLEDSTCSNVDWAYNNDTSPSDGLIVRNNRFGVRNGLNLGGDAGGLGAHITNSLWQNNYLLIGKFGGGIRLLGNVNGITFYGNRIVRAPDASSSNPRVLTIQGIDNSDIVCLDNQIDKQLLVISNVAVKAHGNFDRQGNPFSLSNSIP